MQKEFINPNYPSFKRLQMIYYRLITGNINKLTLSIIH